MQNNHDPQDDSTCHQKQLGQPRQLNDQGQSCQQITLSMNGRHSWVKWLLPVVVLLLGVALSVYFLAPKPTKKARMAKAPVRTVQISPVEKVTVIPTITAHGIVEAKRSVNIQSQLRGEVVELGQSLIPGAFIQQGDILVRIDDRDYQLAIDEAKAQIARQKALYDVEQGRSQAAAMELEISGHHLSVKEQALVLRRPQLAQVQAEVARYDASLKRAQVELERTTIVAPFDAKLLSIDVTEGSLLRDNSNVMNLVATDTFWLRVNIPSHQLRHIEIPDKHSAREANGCVGANVKIRNSVEWHPQAYRLGCVISMLPSVDSKIKTAVLMIEIDDPLSQRSENKNKPKVLINSLLQADIETRPFHSVVAIPRKHLQQGQFVWLMNDKNRLEAREVSIAFRGDQNVVIDSGLNAGDKIVTSTLPGAVEGIAIEAKQDKSLRIAKQNSAEPKRAKSDAQLQETKTSDGKKKRNSNKEKGNEGRDK
ncbi:efflux RND transporter periplasmic adaptor subunit [Vibrio sp. FNV 38]|nr:efflux RND transporter periplasmic adaptor subunit [Vibrio sp. FNV 38]